MLADATVVRRLRIRAHASDAIALQRRVTAAAAGADLHGALLPRGAILCIRRMDDPRPRAFGLAGERMRPAAEWEAAARGRIAGLAAHAARPARGAVPPSADAVLFLDRAELLACLASDWADGRLAACWWWQALFAGLDVAAVVRAWRDAPERVPAACALLASRQRLAPVVRELLAADALSLARDVARAYGIEAVERVLARRGVQRSPAEAPAGERPAVDSEAAAGVARGPVRGGTAWQQCAPEIARAVLSPEQRLLAVLGLVLHRSPSAARRILSDEGVRAVLASPELSPRETSSVTGAPRSMEPGPDQDASTGAALPESVVPGDPAWLDETPERPRAAIDVAAREIDSASPADPPGATPLPAARPLVEVVDTQFGGVFYLVNVAIAMGLYGDFTSPRAVGIDLPVWDFLVLLADRLLRDERFGSDPIVPFLARLAGRDPATPPGAGFTPPDGGTLDGWVEALAPRLLARVAAALGVEEAGAAPLLLRHAAHVSLSPSHLDVAFPLADVRIEIRAAGLDRDPGFVPAAGLTITFSYD